ncbi:MAG: protein kinase [Planctomycetota bacterium]
MTERLELPGYRVPGYQVTGELGRGGMGAVHEVVHEQTGGRYALERLYAEGDAEDRARLVREALILAQLQHPGLVRIHAADLARPDPYLVLELLPGGSLAQRIARGGPLTPAAARELGVTLAEAPPTCTPRACCIATSSPRPEPSSEPERSEGSSKATAQAEGPSAARRPRSETCSSTPRGGRV